MAEFPNLSLHRYKEHRGLGTGAEHVLHWEPLPAHFRGSANVELIVKCPQDIPWDEFHMWQVEAYMFPMTRGNRGFTVTSTAFAKVIYDQTVAKVSDELTGVGWHDVENNPSTDADNASTISNEDLELGDTDGNLVWQPGKLNKSAYTNPAETARLIHHRQKSGWPYQGTAFRTAATGNARGPTVRTMTKHNWSVELATITESYFMVVMCIPGNWSDTTYDEWGDAYLTPRQQNWSSLKYMTPELEKVSGQQTIYPSTVEDFERHMEILYTNGDRQWNQQALDIQLDIDINIMRGVTDVNIEPGEGDAYRTTKENQGQPAGTAPASS